MPDEALIQVASLEAWVALHAEVHREDLGGSLIAVHFEPRYTNALPMTWYLVGDSEVLLEAGAGAGGQWELPMTPAGVAFLRQVVRGIVAGRVSETFGRERSCVKVDLDDGTTSSSTGVRGWLPAFGWKRRGRTVQYESYH